MIERLNIGSSTITSSREAPAPSTATTPFGLKPRSPSWPFKAGRRRSMSMSRTLVSRAWARAPARLIAVVVFPSPMLGLDTPTTETPVSVCIFSTRWRRVRYCSPAKLFGVSRVTRRSLTLSASSSFTVGTLSVKAGASDGLIENGIGVGATAFSVATSVSSSVSSSASTSAWSSGTTSVSIPGSSSVATAVATRTSGST